MNFKLFYKTKTARAILISIAVLLAGGLVYAAFLGIKMSKDRTLSAPSLNAKEDKLDWNNIDGNEGYELYCDEEYFAHVKEDVNEYELLEVDPDCEFQVRAKGDGLNTLDSDLSDKVSVRKLDAPSNVRVSQTKVSWNAVADADSYLIGGDVAPSETRGLSYDLRSMKPGKYSISIQAISKSDEVSNSDLTFVSVNIEKKSLGTLRGVAVKYDRLVWERLENSSGYKISIKQDGKLYKEITENSKSDFCDFLEIGLVDGTYSVEIYALGNEFYKDSAKEIVSYTKTTSVTNKPDLDSIQNAVIHQGILKWDGVVGADGYVINIMSNDVEIYNANIAGDEPLELDITTLGLVRGDYAVMLYALGNERYNNSPTVLLSYTILGLDKPANLKYDGAKLTWTHAEGADYYLVAIGSQKPVRTDSNAYEIALLPGSYAIAVQAISDNREVLNSPLAVLAHTEPKRALGEISDSRIEYGVFKWSALPNAAGYVVEIRSPQGSVLHVYERAVSNDLEVDLYAVNLPLGEYVIVIKALGDDVYNDSAEVSLSYHEKMIRDAHVRANVNYRYPNSEDYWIQHYLDFSLKQGMTLSNLNAPMEEWNAVYTDFLSGSGETKRNAAASIGNDIIVSYYYKDENEQNVVLFSTGGVPFVKNKLWGKWLWRYNGTEYVQLQGDIAEPFSIGGIVPSKTTLRVSANIGRKSIVDGISISSTQLDDIAGKKLYVDVDLIIADGDTVKFYRETTELDIPGF